MRRLPFHVLAALCLAACTSDPNGVGPATDTAATLDTSAAPIDSAEPEPDSAAATDVAEPEPDSAATTDVAEPEPDALASDSEVAADSAVAADVDTVEPGPYGGPVFDETVLHTIAVDFDPSYTDTLDNDRSQRVPCTFTFDGVVLAEVGLREKGGYGSNSPIAEKPPFSLKFDTFIADQRLFGLKKLVLNNHQEDPTLLSETLSYWLWRRAGMPAPLSSYAVVSVNGEPKGIYVVKEPIADDFLERNFGKSNDGGNVYEGFYHPEDLSLGDFVLHPEETDLKDEVEDGRSRADINALAAAIDETPDDTWAVEVGARMDLDHYLRAFALTAILGYWDSLDFYNNNYYLYHNPADGLFVTLPHGMDQVRFDGDVESWPMGRLAQRVRSIEALDERYHAQVEELLATVWDVAAIHARIDAIAALLHSTTRDDWRTQGDLESLDDYMDSIKDAVASH
ncbi:MAG: CotH kinase family protein [Myxococcota bacterium]